MIDTGGYSVLWWDPLTGEPLYDGIFTDPARDLAACHATQDLLTSAYFHGLLVEQSPYPQHEGQMTHHEHD